MSDQKRWFKVWTSLIVDMDLLPNEVIGAWLRLGCRAALVGHRGRLHFHGWEHVATYLRVPIPRAKTLVFRLPNVLIEEGENRHGEITVTFKNWTKYQEDSTQAERAKTSRSKRRGDKTREDERRGEGATTPIQGGSDQPEPRVRAVPKPISRRPRIRYGRGSLPIRGPIRPIVDAWVAGFTARFRVAPGDPKPWDLDAAEDLLARHGLPLVLEILDGVFRVGTHRLRTKDRWSLQAIADEWEALVAMRAKGELR